MCGCKVKDTPDHIMRRKEPKWLKDSLARVHRADMWEYEKAVLGVLAWALAFSGIGYLIFLFV